MLTPHLHIATTEHSDRREAVIDALKRGQYNEAIHWQDPAVKAKNPNLDQCIERGSDVGRHVHTVPFGMEVRRMGRLEHRQLPFHTILVEAQNVQIAVVAFDLEVAIVWSVPLIDVFDDFDLARIEPKAHWHFDAEMTGAALDL